MSHPGWIVEYLQARWRHADAWQLGSPMRRRARMPRRSTSIASSVRPFDAQTWRDLETYRKLFPRALMIKGIMNPADAIRALEIGCDGIQVSNHGGRQLDQAPASLDVLPAIKAAVGDRAAIVLDSGVRRGADILIALCLGADFVVMGRPTLYGAAAGGLAGVKKAVDIFRQRDRPRHGPDRLPQPRPARPRFPVDRRLGAQHLIAEVAAS